ncbi:hypothetical protein BC826DRAFT_971955 [Russula brevipes]|nr:hypothetical protein BC826DRAFT_971955 [Russula brevipes]
MLSILNLWAFFLPSLLVVGAPTTLSPGDTSLAKVTSPQPDATTVTVSVGGQLRKTIRRLASNEQPSYPIQTLVNSPTSPLRSTHVSCLRWRNATPKSTSSGTPYKMR